MLADSLNYSIEETEMRRLISSGKFLFSYIFSAEVHVSLKCSVLNFRGTSRLFVLKISRYSMHFLNLNNYHLR